MPNAGLINTVFAIALVLILGWLLYIGQGILLPIFAAVICVYILNTGAAVLARQPLLRRFPTWLLRILVLFGFTLALLCMVLIFRVTVLQMETAAPTYQANLERLVASVSLGLGFEDSPTWDEISAATVDRIDVEKLLGLLLASITSFGGTVFAIALYAGFLFSERAGFEGKLQAAFPGDRDHRLLKILNDINEHIGDYLTVKTMINVVLALVSYVVMWAMDVDFAPYWALQIGVLNYIPYVGSVLGVAFPVILSLAQFGSLPETLALMALLTFAQFFMGNIIEPRVIGKQLNLSPFVVLIALSVWGALWGIPGAILAVPMTSVIVIVCEGFPETRFIAILLSDRVGDEAGAKAAPPA
ncbi:AI-2E family transporter [Tropicimonas sp.]|uniref:AI-2E family transporter n=1 Tax=Tropicimonas sp. TaxID=2067044 RepID=UPI003A884E0E